MKHAHPYLKRRPPVSPHRGHHASTSWSIPALCAAYGWPKGAPGGGIIAIVELGGGWNQADVSAAFAAMNLPLPSITDVSVDGTTNSPGNDADGEVALDIQVAGAAYAAATGKAATIRMYWATDIAAAVNKATADGCDVCSISWGADEETWGKAGANAMEAAAAAAVAAGMVVFAAAGDNDSSDGGNTPANVDAPASCPHVIGCGGTAKPKIGSEVVWNNNPGNADGSGTGGGYSTFFPVQAWQTGGPPPPTHQLGRMVPDVSAVADPTTGYEIVLNGQTQVFGGTSAVAPLYAGLFAAFGKKLGFVTPELYGAKSDFVDVVSGDNGFYHARPGPDACTGIGVPIGKALAATVGKV